MEYLQILEKGIWFGLGGVGFAILFNVPNRTLLAIWILAALGGITKLALIHFGLNVILASFAGATLIGFLSIQAAHSKHAPPPVFSIPAVIPMVPGVFAYRMMIGLIKLGSDFPGTEPGRILTDTVSNGLKAVFILLALALGVAIPMLITRKSTVKYLRIKRKV